MCEPAAAGTFSLSLHDALPISLDFLGLGPGLGEGAQQLEVIVQNARGFAHREAGRHAPVRPQLEDEPDRKSTRLNSSHGSISYAVFCLKKKSIGVGISSAVRPR